MVIHANAKSHYVVTEGPLDALDHASNRAFQGYRLGIDATQKLPLEHSASLPIKAVDLSASVHILPTSQAKEDMPLHSYRYIILVDDDVPVDNYSTVSWKVFNNIDANRDISYKNRDDGTICLIIDATKKGEKDGLLRPWPDDIKMSETIQSLVTEKWNTYGIK
jgi:4-hydroxy-3-polyprenylbenzoate decarboxylase